MIGMPVLYERRGVELLPDAAILCHASGMAGGVVSISSARRITLPKPCSSNHIGTAYTLSSVGK